MVCQSTRLNPFKKQIYAVKIQGQMVIMTAIDGFRAVAEDTGAYRGQVGPFWCGPDGQWRDVWLESTPPVAARVGILRDGFSEPIWAVARYESYVQLKDGQPTRFWKTMPDVMTAKCAESLGLRKTFPDQLSGLYTAEEMGQAENTPAPVSRQLNRATGEIVDRPKSNGNHQTPAEMTKTWNRLKEKAPALGIAVSELESNISPARFLGRIQNLEARITFGELAGEAKSRGRAFDPLPAACTVTEIGKRISEVKDFLTGFALPEVEDEAESVEEAL
jgi:phage recombination protein Bet